MKTAHPICLMMRELRLACGMSLDQAERRIGVSAIVLGSYERGDRIPPLEKAEQVLNGYGYKIVAIPQTDNAVRLPTNMASELRLIADQLERNNDVPELSRDDALVS